MSSTAEGISNYSISCLEEASDSPTSTSSISDADSKDSSINADESTKSVFDANYLFSETNSTENTFEGFSSHSDSFQGNQSKVDIGVGVDFSLNLILEKLNDLEHSLKMEKQNNINLKYKLNQLENRYRRKLTNLNNDIEDLYDDLNSVDLKVIQLDQYTRRESLVISGIDDNISQDQLEYTVLKILRTLGCTVSSYEITACHRLFNKNNRYPARTIIRFTNRKIVNYCLQNRDKLQQHRRDLHMNLRLYEHLTDSNELVLKECIKLAKYEIIESYFIRNGFVKIIVNPGDRPLKIHHSGILYDKFKDFYDHQDLDYMP